MIRVATGLTFAALLAATAVLAQPVSDPRAEALDYWAQAKAAAAPPPKVAGCLSEAASRRVIALQAAAATADQTAWLDAWLKGSQAYGASAGSWKVQRTAVDTAPDSPAEDAAVTAGLAARARLDQAVRAAAAPADLAPLARAIHDSLLAQAVCRTDDANTRWLKAVVQERGWPDRKRYGAAADHDAARLVEHAQNDITWQREALVLVRALLDTDATDPANVAVLADRISVLQNRPQRFGTQGACAGPGRWVAEMVENPEEIDDRRAELGLPPLAADAATRDAACR